MALRVARVVVVVPIALTTTSASTATIGVVPRAVATTRGFTASTASLGTCAGPTTLRRTGIRCVASRTIDNLVI